MYLSGKRGSQLIGEYLYFLSHHRDIVRLNLLDLTLNIAEKKTTGFEGDRIFSEEATDFFVTQNQKDLYLLQPNGNVIRLNADQHIALSSIVQVTDWMSITKMGSFVVVAGWNNMSQENTFVLLSKELEYADRLDVSCKTSCRLR